MKRPLTALGMVLALIFLLPQLAVARLAPDAPMRLPLSAASVHLVQYLNDFPSPRIRRLPPALRMRPRPPRVRRPPVPPRAFAPPLPSRQGMRRPAQRSAITIKPSEALRLAQRRWPASIGLSVRLLRQDPPMYVVRLRTRSRVVQVLVDARSGRVLQ